MTKRSKKVTDYDAGTFYAVAVGGKAREDFRRGVRERARTEHALAARYGPRVPPEGREDEVRATVTVRCSGKLHRVTLSNNGPFIFHDHPVSAGHLLTTFQLADESPYEALAGLGCVKLWMILGGKRHAVPQPSRQTLERREPIKSLGEAFREVATIRRRRRLDAARQLSEAWRKNERVRAFSRLATEAYRKAGLARPETPAVAAYHAPRPRLDQVRTGPVVYLPVRWLSGVHLAGLAVARDGEAGLLVLDLVPGTDLGVALGRTEWDVLTLYTVRLDRRGDAKRLGVYHPELGGDGLLTREALAVATLPGINPQEGACPSQAVEPPDGALAAPEEATA